MSDDDDALVRGVSAIALAVEEGGASLEALVRGAPATAPAGKEGSPSLEFVAPATSHSSVTTSNRRKILRIHALLKRFDAHTANGVDEALVFRALLAIHIENSRQRLSDIILSNGRPNHLS